jgi:hypothetical protein
MRALSGSYSSARIHDQTPGVRNACGGSKEIW